MEIVAGIAVAALIVAGIFALFIRHQEKSRQHQQPFTKLCSPTTQLFCCLLPTALPSVRLLPTAYCILPSVCSLRSPREIQSAIVNRKSSIAPALPPEPFAFYVDSTTIQQYSFFMYWRMIFYRNASGKCPMKAKTLRKDYFMRVKGGKNG